MRVYRFVTGPIQVNTYLAFDETKKGFIVDPGGFSYELTGVVDQEGLEIEYIILTHGHADHIGGVAEFQEKYPNAKVIAYTAERDMLEDPALNSSYDIYRRAITVTPDRYVSDRETLTVGDTELTFIHTPGHSLGGMCILTPGYVFSGDTIFRASIGRTDFYGGSFDQLAKSIRERLYILPDQTLVLPGHMSETTIGFEKEHNPFVPN
ncbi:MAG: MBL fold metallo-hydrolase [Firmicutes bacterium]|nr:MBL fold metallo-hydrolase [Bacillota bacterium]